MWWLFVVFLTGIVEIFMWTLKFFDVFHLFHFSCGFFLGFQESWIHLLFERTTCWVVSLRCDFILLFILLNFGDSANWFLYQGGWSLGLWLLRRFWWYWSLFLLGNDGLNLLFIHFEFNLFRLLIIIVWIMRRGWMSPSRCCSINFHSPCGDLAWKNLFEEMFS